MLSKFRLKAWTQTQSISMSCIGEVSLLWEQCTWQSAASTLSVIYYNWLHGWCNGVAEMPVRLVGLQLDPFRLVWSDSSGRMRGWGRWAQEQAGGGLVRSVLRQHCYNINLTSEKLWETFSAFLNLWSLPPATSSKPLKMLDIHHKHRHQYVHFL